MKHNKVTPVTLFGLLTWIKEILIKAPRLGSEVDKPEGTRYIQLSETLVNQILAKIEEWI